MHNPSSPAAPHIKTTWWLMLAYLLVGYGAYTALKTALLILQIFARPWWMLVDALLILTFLVGSTWFFGGRRGQFSLDEIGLLPARWHWKWLGGVGGLALTVVLFNLLSSAVMLWLQNKPLGSLWDGNFSGTLTSAQWGEVLILWVSLGLIIPFAEEFYFRGAIFTWFGHRFGAWASVIGSLLLFAITRADLFSPGTSILVIQSIFLGLVTTLLMWRFRSLWLSFTVHALSVSLMLALAVFL